MRPSKTVCKFSPLPPRRCRRSEWIPLGDDPTRMMRLAKNGKRTEEKWLAPLIEQKRENVPSHLFINITSDKWYRIED